MTSPAALHPAGLTAMLDALLAVDRLRAGKIVKDSCIPGSPVTCVETLIVPALEEIGRRWEDGSVALSQVYMSGRICEEIVDTMLPPGDPQRIGKPKLAIAVFEDHHTLGKRIVFSVIRAGGYEITDYGHGIMADDLVQMVLSDHPQILLLSTLMLPSAIRAKEAIARIREQLPETKIIVGGAPFNFDPALWQEIGADAVGRTATETLEIVNRFAREMGP